MFDFDFSKPIVDFSNFEFSQLGEALIFGGSMLLIGIAAVFAVLCILWLFLTVFKLVFHDLPKRKAEKNKLAPIVVIPEKKVEETTVNDGEIVAVIAAAIAMAESENSGMKFRVVSFKRV
ncbi:MAG: OadG family protein [Clostridia bacterium]|nr:OadG family protein [Clostridia bacterium]